MSDLEFRNGMTVTVTWTDGQRVTGTVKHIPCDVGDMWHVETDAALVAINPSALTLEAIEYYKPVK